MLQCMLRIVLLNRRASSVYLSSTCSGCELHSCIQTCFCCRRCRMTADTNLYDKKLLPCPCWLHLCAVNTWYLRHEAIWLHGCWYRQSQNLEWLRRAFNGLASHRLPLSTYSDCVSFCSKTWSIKPRSFRVQQVSRLETIPMWFLGYLMTLEGLPSPGRVFIWSNWCNIPLSGALSCSALSAMPGFNSHWCTVTRANESSGRP